MLQNLRSIFSLVLPYALLTLGLLIPASRAMADIVVAIVFVGWLVQGNFKAKFKALWANSMFKAFVCFCSIHIIGILWTTNLHDAINLCLKEGILLLMPIIASAYLKKEHKVWAVSGFIISMLISVLLSFMLELQLIQPFKHNIYSNIPFIGHIHYSPFLAIAILLIIVYFKRIKDQGISAPVLLIVIAAMVFDLLITRGRAGQVALVAGVLIYILFLMPGGINRRIIAFSLTIIAIALSYSSIKPFKSKIDEAWKEVAWYTDQNYANSSVGKRFLFFLYSEELIRQKPIFGHGTGSFASIYKEINAERSPDLPPVLQPHNQYMLTLVQFGLLGLALFAWWWIAMYYQSIKNYCKDVLLAQARILFLSIYMLIMFSDSYLLGHDSALLFAFLGGIFFSLNLADPEASAQI